VSYARLKSERLSLKSKGNAIFLRTDRTNCGLIRPTPKRPAVADSLAKWLTQRFPGGVIALRISNPHLRQGLVIVSEARDASGLVAGISLAALPLACRIFGHSRQRPLHVGSRTAS
jgi:hypothetical protein